MSDTPSPTPTPPPAGGSPKWLSALGPDVQPPRGGAPSGSLAPVDGGGSPTPPTPEPPAPVAPPAGTPPTPGAPPVQPPTPTTGPAPGQVLQLTPELMNQLVQGVAAAAAPAAPAQPQYTQEQLDQLFNVHRVTKEHMMEILGIPEPSDAQIAAFNAFGQAIARQAAAVSAFQMNLARKQLESVLEPLQSHFQEARTKAAEDRFYGKYPGLSEYRPLVNQIGQSLAQQNRSWKNEDEAFQEVVNETVRLLKSVGVDISSKLSTPPAGGAATPPQPTQPNPNGMPTLSAGGQGGVGGTTTTGNTTPRWKSALAD